MHLISFGCMCVCMCVCVFAPLKLLERSLNKLGGKTDGRLRPNLSLEEFPRLLKLLNRLNDTIDITDRADSENVGVLNKDGAHLRMVFHREPAEANLITNDVSDVALDRLTHIQHHFNLILF